MSSVNPRYGYLLLLALSVAAPTYLVAQQAIAPTAVQLNEQSFVTKPAYDVATIRRGNWGLHGGSMLQELKFSDDSFIAREMPLVILVSAAYGVEGYQVSRGPDWVRDGHEGYDVTAKTTEDATIETLHKMVPKQEKLVQEQAAPIVEKVVSSKIRGAINEDVRGDVLADLISRLRELKDAP